MPYRIEGKCIYKKDGGAKVGCTKGDVHKYMSALLANTHESINSNGELINEDIKLDIQKGDIILGGKFRNKKIVVKTIGTDEHGSPTVNGKSILNVRIEKLMKDKKKDIKESKDLIKTLLREELQNRFNIIVKDDEAGYIHLRPIPKFGKDCVEIINIKIDTKDFKGIKVAMDAVSSIFKQSDDINKIYIAPREESRDFWEHVGFTRLNDDYWFIMRGH